MKLYTAISWSAFFMLIAIVLFTAATIRFHWLLELGGAINLLLALVPAAIYRMTSDD